MFNANSSNRRLGFSELILTGINSSSGYFWDSRILVLFQNFGNSENPKAKVLKLRPPSHPPDTFGISGFAFGRIAIVPVVIYSHITVGVDRTDAATTRESALIFTNSSTL